MVNQAQRVLPRLFLYCAIAVLAFTSNQNLSAAPVSSTQTAVQTSTGSLTFTWTNQPGNSYTVALATGPTNDDFNVPVSSGTTALDSATTSFIGLLANTSYFFRVKVATDTDGGADPPVSYGGQISTFTLPILPSLQATVNSTDSITITLGLNANTSGSYNVQLSTDPDFSGDAVTIISATGTLPSGATTFAELLSNTTYFVKARTLWNGTSIEDLEENASGFILISTATLPVLPNLSLVSVGIASFTVSVTVGVNSSTGPYEISFSTNSDFSLPVTTPAIGILPSGNTSFADLIANATYFIRARALWNSAGINLLQNASGFTATISTTVFPVLPTLEVTVNSTDSITVLIGTSATNPDAGGDYNIQFSTDPAFGGVGVSVISTTGTLPSGATTFAGLSRNTTFFIRARTLWNGQSQGLEQNASGFISLSTATLPVLPVLSLVGVGFSSFTVSVTADVNSSTGPYEISFSTNSDFNSFVTTSAIGVLPSGNTSFADLIADATYFIRARALWNSAGINLLQNASGFTATISTKTDAPTASNAPTAFTITDFTANSITYAWTDNSSDEDGFRVLDAASGILGSVGPNVTTFQLTGLSPNASVTAVGVSAFNSVGASTRATTLTKLTLANPPSSPIFKSVTKTEATISWSTNSNPSTVVYEVSRSTSNFAFSAGISTPIPFNSNFKSSATTVGGLTAGGTFFFRIRARNSELIPTAFSSVISTFTPASQVIQSTGGAVDAGETTVTADAGVTVTNTTLADGSVQQTIISTETATVTYGSGISLELPPGLLATVIASGDSIQLTSTGTVPITESGFTIEATSGTLTVVTSADTLTVSLATDAPQNVVTTIPTTGAKTVAITLNPPSGAIKTSIPPGALKKNVRLRIKLPDSFPAATAALKGASQPGSLNQSGPLAALPFGTPFTLTGLGIGLEITLDQNIQPVKPIPITMGYRDSDIGSSDPETLAVARFETTTQKWITLPAFVNAFARSVTGTTKLFSTFQLMAVNPASDVKQAKVFPNPLRTHRGQTEMTFINLSAQASIKIYTYLGELVREIKADATGTARWDARNSSGKLVGSGVYHALIEGSADSERVLKLAVEK